ncbi:hypothetical protein [Bradyrhizobium acaciae]|uniref:hypothetical protein n=1 Tax=Bradyrhizobium acaciae TaxID=2683706 RepID=UPI001E3630A3|nr:hypothetical protein [Bradyrhizobium acaciae]MCC8983292.1 hypothetical protein [Bradyrhizobium acaciae]
MERPVFKYPDLIGCDLFGRPASNIRVTGGAMRGRQGRSVRAARAPRQPVLPIASADRSETLKRDRSAAMRLLSNRSNSSKIGQAVEVGRI